MSLLTASNLKQSFGSFDLFQGITLSIPHQSKIGLVGPNGIGKTTLLLLLAGITKPADGEIHVAKDTAIGYLSQESSQQFIGKTHSVIAEMQTVFAYLKEKQATLHQMEQEIARHPEDDSLYEQYSRLLDEFNRIGGYEYPVWVKQTLVGLGFKEASWETPLDQLSGGQKTRLVLARLLLQKPDLLILDEPTNHLDVTAVEWLESTLSSWSGSVLVVSHDRFFLNQVVDTIWEMGQSYLESYRGNYTAYTKQREERWAHRETEFNTIKSKMEKELEFIRKHMAGRGTQQAQGKLSRLSRELQAIEQGGIFALHGKSWVEAASEFDISRISMSVEDATWRVKALKNPVPRPRSLNLTLSTDQRSGKLVLRTYDLVVGYPDHPPLFNSEDLELHRLERAALIGPNGAGKTTFLRLLLGDLVPVSGKFELGASLNVGYFSQVREDLDLEQTILDNLLLTHPMPLSEARKYLARYQFRGEDIYKPVSTLSGGERSRLALSFLILREANFLILDEPTNHLDILSQEILEEALLEFDGTILLVSHDRYLVNRLATQIWWVADGQLQQFDMSYDQFVTHQKEEALTQRTIIEEKAKENKPPEPPKQISKNALRKQAKEIERLEQQIIQTESRLEMISSELESAALEESFDKMHSLGLEYTELEKLLDSLVDKWEKLACE